MCLPRTIAILPSETHGTRRTYVANPHSPPKWSCERCECGSPCKSSRPYCHRQRVGSQEFGNAFIPRSRELVVEGRSQQKNLQDGDARRSTAASRSVAEIQLFNVPSTIKTPLSCPVFPQKVCLALERCLFTLPGILHRCSVRNQGCNIGVQCGLSEQNKKTQKPTIIKTRLGSCGQ